MAFEDYETSQESGSRVELFDLSVGSETYRMHDQMEEIIVYAANNYFKTHIKRGKIADGQEHLTIELPGDHVFATKFTTIAPGQKATLTAYAYHRADTADVRVIYKGVVRSVAFTKDIAKSILSVVPISEAFNKEIPDRTYQAACNNVLFDAKCKVTISSYQFTGTVSVVSGNQITVPGLTASKGANWSKAGYVAFGSADYRMILTQPSDVLTLTLPFYSDVLSETIDVFAGCARDIGTCNTKFSNKDNFGGCPYVPTKNIFVTGL
jgi:uncharacterized phage protein (TIGR02218 family)